jgi:hypothetical protein
MHIIERRPAFTKDFVKKFHETLNHAFCFRHIVNPHTSKYIILLPSHASAASRSSPCIVSSTSISTPSRRNQDALQLIHAGVKIQVDPPLPCDPPSESEFEKFDLLW